MADPLFPTLPHVRSDRGIRRARNSRRAGLVLLGLLVLAGLTGFLGIRTASVTGEADGYRLTVTTPKSPGPASPCRSTSR